VEQEAALRIDRPAEVDRRVRRRARAFSKRGSPMPGMASRNWPTRNLGESIGFL
jgi:hypothetical protein